MSGRDEPTVCPPQRKQRDIKQIEGREDGEIKGGLINDMQEGREEGNIKVIKEMT